MSGAGLMRERGAAATLGALAVTLAVPAALLAASVQLVASRAALEVEYSRPGFPAPVGMSADERLDAATVAARHVVGRGTDHQLMSLRLDGRRLFADDEVQHLVDVRRLVELLSILGLVGGCVLVASAARWLRRRGDWFPGGLQLGGGATVGLVLLTMATVAVAWRAFFVGFHELFFDPGTWQFSTSSGLIRLFPEQFWFDTAVALGALCLVGGLLVLATGRWLGRKGLSAGGKEPA